MREYLKALRLKKGLTMQEVAERFGISKQYYEMIESGERQKRMDVTLLTKIAGLFEVSIESIVAEEQKLLDAEEEQACAAS